MMESCEVLLRHFQSSMLRTQGRADMAAFHDKPALKVALKQGERRPTSSGRVGLW